LIQSIRFFRSNDPLYVYTYDDNGIAIEKEWGGKCTWDDFKILSKERPIFSPPSPKTNFINIPGGNGALDISESLTGFPTYNDREGSWTFRVMNDYKPWHERYSEIMAFIHGQELTAILFDDQQWMYKGRFWVSDWKSADTWSEITISYRVNPHKWSIFTPGEAWLWDPFNFDNGVIKDKKFNGINISGILTQTFGSSNGDFFGNAPIVPTFYWVPTDRVSHLSVDFRNEFLGLNLTATVRPGLNVMHDLVIFGNDTYTMTFRGNGVLDIDYQAGRL